MTTVEHQVLVEMFRAQPALGPRLLNLMVRDQIAPDVSVKVGESVLDQKMSMEHRADLLLEVRDAKEALVAVIIVEVQRHVDQDKLWSWPHYFTTARMEHKCEPTLLVVALDEKVAAWANRGTEFRDDQGFYKPVVLGPSVIPVITDLATAEKDVELSVLSAIVYGDTATGMDVVSAALHAAMTRNRKYAAAYYKIIYESLGEPMQAVLRKLLMDYQALGNIEFPEFARELINYGKVEGLREGELKGLREGELKGLREGELKGLREGELKGKRETLFRLLERVRISLSDAQRLQIENCADALALDKWIENVFGAKNAGDVFS